MYKAKIDIIENAKSFTVIVGDTSTTFSIIIEQPNRRSARK